MATIPQWLLGRHLTAVVLTPMTVAVDGTLTAQTPQNITFYTQSIELESEVLGEDIRPVNSPIANFVGHTEDSTLTLEILLHQAGAGTPSNPVASVMATHNVFEISFTRGGSTWAGTFARQSLRDGVRSRGRNVSVAVFRQVDAGDAPMSVAASAGDIGYFAG